eukprot:gene6456-7739_t
MAEAQREESNDIGRNLSWIASRSFLTWDARTSGFLLPLRLATSDAPAALPELLHHKLACVEKKVYAHIEGVMRGAIILEWLAELEAIGVDMSCTTGESTKAVVVMSEHYTSWNSELSALAKVNLIMKPHDIHRIEINTGIMYAQGAAPEGPVTHIFRDTYLRFNEGDQEYVYSAMEEAYQLAAGAATANGTEYLNRLRDKLPYIVHVRDQGGQAWEKEWRFAQL